jgi:hypothetical protein
MTKQIPLVRRAVAVMLAATALPSTALLAQDIQAPVVAAPAPDPAPAATPEPSAMPVLQMVQSTPAPAPVDSTGDSKTGETASVAPPPVALTNPQPTTKALSRSVSSHRAAAAVAPKPVAATSQPATTPPVRERVSPPPVVTEAPAAAPAQTASQSNVETPSTASGDDMTMLAAMVAGFIVIVGGLVSWLFMRRRRSDEYVLTEAEYIAPARESSEKDPIFASPIKDRQHKVVDPIFAEKKAARRAPVTDPLFLEKREGPVISDDPLFAHLKRKPVRARKAATASELENV